MRNALWTPGEAYINLDNLQPCGSLYFYATTLVATEWRKLVSELARWTRAGGYEVLDDVKTRVSVVAACTGGFVLDAFHHRPASLRQTLFFLHNHHRLTFSTVLRVVPVRIPLYFPNFDSEILLQWLHQMRPGWSPHWGC